MVKVDSQHYYAIRYLSLVTLYHTNTVLYIMDRDPDHSMSALAAGVHTLYEHVCDV